MKIKKNDSVKVIKGKDKGKKGKVLKVFPKEGKIIVEGINLLVKHVRPKKEREKGQRIQFPAAMDISKVMLVCPRCNKTTRVGYKVVPKTETKKRKKVRICKKCKEVVD